MKERIEQCKAEKPSAGSLVTVRLLRFKGFKARWQALAEMGRTRMIPWHSEGLTFNKHLGSGAGNGFSILPDFGTYAWLGIWQSSEEANSFFERDERWLSFQSMAIDWKGWDGIPIRAHGTWNGRQPFVSDSSFSDWNGPVAVLTRASIKRSKALRFWMNVPGSSKHIEQQPGLIFAKGVGELPLVEQATLSLWDSVKAVQSFAYKDKAHSPMVRKTREIGWYSEEMFVRMAVTANYGFAALQPE